MDKMSESQDMDMDTSSVGGLSEEGTGSLVAFGEGARTPARQSTVGSPAKTHGFGARDAKIIDGVTYDRNVVDTTITSDPRRGGGGTAPSAGVEEAERIVREMNTTSADRMRKGNPGKSGFEK